MRTFRITGIDEYEEDVHKEVGNVRQKKIIIDKDEIWEG